MFFEKIKFEINYFKKQPSFYVCLLVFFLFPFFAMISDNVQIGGASNVDFNAPHAITQTILIMTIIGMFLVANFVGGAAVRDYNHKMDGIMLSQPVSKTSFLWGRLTGAYLFCLIVFAAVPLGIFIGSFWPTVDPERLGATSLMPYLWAYLIFVIPNFLFAATLFYVFALVTRSMMGMYLGVIGFFVLYSIAGAIAENPNNAQMGALIDPFGISAFVDATRYWTPFERNTQLVPLEGNLLLNRVLWLSLAVVIAVLTHLFVDIRKNKKVKNKKEKREKALAPTTYSVVKPSHDSKSSWQHFKTRTKFEISQTIKSPPFIILCLFALFMLSPIYFESTGLFGTDDWPITRDMVGFVTNTFFLIILIIITYYSGEIVWRERQLGIGDIVESTPINNWSLYFPKVIALTLIILTLSLLGVLFTSFFQVTRGYTNFEWGVYFGMSALNLIIPMVMMTILAFFIQVVSSNKYLGMLIFVGIFILQMTLSNLGFEHNLWHFAIAPNVVYSDLNQYGHFLEANLWYSLYWLGLVVVLTTIGYGLWRRGAEYDLKSRFAQLKKNLGMKGLIATTLGLLVFVSSGSWVFYNTRVLNDFVTSDERLDLRAEYEDKYKQYENQLLPTITDVYAEVDFYPSERQVKVKGHYLLVNNNDEPLNKTLINWRGGKHREFEFTIQGGKQLKRDVKFDHAWIKFDRALQPGEKTRLDFEYVRGNKGFVDQGSDTRVVTNGSFVNSDEILPHFGYNANFEIADRHERRKRDMQPRDRVAKLEDESRYGINFVGAEADFINFETIVSTETEQFAISPGYLQKQWQKDGRSYYHYKMDAPIFNYVAFLSGKYASKKEQHDGVSIEVYHHPDHNMNVDRMIEATKSSLDYFGKEFSPYQHRQVRIIEFPRYARFAQSFSNTIPYSEDIGFIADLRDESNIDYVYFVTAHEMAHQWWGHQVTPADVQGGAVLSETLAEYSAYMVMEKRLGKHHLRKFLKYEMDRYLRARSSELIEEMPLYRAENQQYIHYQKGGVVMYSLRDRYGEKVINTALKKFLEKYQYASNPYPTTLNLIDFLKAEIPVEGHAFVDDLFKKITLFDLKVESAKVKEIENGKFELELIIDANKYYADGQGEESETPIDINFDIGVFTQDPDDPKAKDHVLYFKKHKLIKGENRVVLQLDKKPVYAGVDPYITLIDRNSNDNLKLVEED